MSAIGQVHLVFSFAAIAAGGLVILIPKGTRWHRTLGHAYVWSMVGLVATALSIYTLTGGFGPFHYAAIGAGLTLVAGMTVVLLRRPRKTWIEAHAELMAWSYVGLLAAFVAESTTRFIMPLAAPLLPAGSRWGVFWTAVAVGSSAVFAVGWWLIRTRLAGAIASTPAAMRRERRSMEGDAVPPVVST